MHRFLEAIVSSGDRLARAHGRLAVRVRPDIVGRMARTGLRAGVAILVASVLLAAGMFAFGSLYGQFGGARAIVNARTWAERTPVFDRSACVSCHQQEAGRRVSGAHASLTCEACHGPLGLHPGTKTSAVPVSSPTSAICVRCHATSAGRPANFPQIELAAHFTGAACLRCHDPHSIVAVTPPEVTHPLVSLPACTTCHAPDGLKKVPAGHELVADAICLTCHKPASLKP